VEDSILRCAVMQSLSGRESSLEICSLLTINGRSVRVLQLQYLELHFSLLRTQPQQSLYH